MERKIMGDTKQVSFSKRFVRSQGGNVVLYIVVGCVLWFVFFSLMDWIRSTKDSRAELEKKARAAQYSQYQDDIYRNPYQISPEH